MFEKTDFPERFGLLIFCRGGAVTDTLLSAYPRLYAHREEFLFPQTPAEAFGVSATEIRRRILHQTDFQNLLEPAVWELIKNVSAEDFPEEIAGFTEEYAFLDNRFPAPLTFRGESYLCAEAAFQATKTADLNQRAAFCSYTGEKAREKGSVLRTTSEWESQKISIMREVLSAKFRQNPALAERLLATGNALLINYSSKRKTFWGMDRYTFAGENMLGKLLTELRETLKEEQK